MRTRALSNKLRRLEARLAERLRFAKPNEEPCRFTLEDRCAGLSRLRRCLAARGFPVPADNTQAIAEFDEARKQGPVPEALTLRTWDVLTGLPPPLP
jgi:hypothetical protein